MSTLTAERAAPAAPAAGLVPLLAVASGVAVADNYYLQPLLALVGADLGASSAAVGGVAALALLGYALGLLLVVPLGDVVDRRPLVTTILGGTVVGLLALALAPSLPVLAVAAFGVGLSSVVAQVLVPYAASLADDASRGRVVGTVFSGILVGILGARVVGSLAGGAVGWRPVYAGAAVLTALLLVVLLRRLPGEPARHRRNGRADVPYRAVLMGVLRLAVDRSAVGTALRVRSLYGACGFGVFSAVWTTLAFHLRDAFGLGAWALAGAALLGVVGAWVAPRAGRLGDRGLVQTATGAAYAGLLLAAGVLWLGASSLPLLLLGLVLTDVGVQVGHMSNLGVVYRMVGAEARSRATTVYMTTVFVGGATGSALAAWAYGLAGWRGTAAVCAGLAALALGRWLVRLPVRAPVAIDEPFPEAVA